MCNIFKFKQFTIEQSLCAMKVGTDGVLLGAWAEGGDKILDIGCGTGIISLMMAQRFPNSAIKSIDVVNECCVQTRKNADDSLWNDRISVENLSLQDFYTKQKNIRGLAEQAKFDSIVSNPPFFVDSLKNPDKHRTLARHTDSLPFDVMVKCVRGLLKDGGVFSVILAEECCNKFINEAWFAELYLCETVFIVTKKGKKTKRRLLRFSTNRNTIPLESTTLLQNDDGSRSEWFQNLTSEFYL